MNFTSVAGVLAILYVLLMAGAAVQDVLTMRISNQFSVAILVVCAAALIVAPGADWWQHLLSFAIVLAFGMLLFSIGWMGGGDAKLMAAAALAFTLNGLLRFLPFVLLAGGVIALLAIFLRKARARRSGEARGGVPYGVAIAIGAIAGVYLFPQLTAFEPERSPFAIIDSITSPNNR